tara:strand:+ start:698 stop:1297 length:600 start_codon:yes stop_codon:yes gene_type:complete
MKAVLDRRFESQRAQDRLTSNSSWIQDRESSLNEALLQKKRDEHAKMSLAACRIEALVRGKIGRIFAAELRAMHHSARVFQRWTRGAQGRKKAREARWKLLRVVPSLYALNLMRKRSREVEKVKSWVEMFDPQTETFWYFNKDEANNGIPNSSWDHPKEFDDKLTCVWEPYAYPHVSKAATNNRCCMRFKTRREYNTHR